MLDEFYDGPSTKSAMAGGMVPGMDVRRPTRYERLISVRKSLTVKLEEVNKAISLFDENPKLAEFVEAIEKVGSF